MQDISIIGIIVAIVVLVILLFMAIGYVKAPPDMAYIISGVKKKSKVVIGKASIRIPFFERLDKLNLSKRQTMRQSLKSTPPIIGDVASCIRPEDYLTMA